MITFDHASKKPGIVDASLNIQAKEKVAIIGRSGSGKTTLLRLICGWLQPESGSITAPGRSEFAYIPQDLDASLNPAMRISDIVLEPVVIAKGDVAAAKQALPELLDSLGLPADTAQRKPRELSGGQRQRVGIARALIAKPSVIYADEALSALDSAASKLVMELFARPDLTVLLVTHDLFAAEQFAQRFLMLDAGRIVEDLPIERLWDPSDATEVRLSFIAAETLLDRGHAAAAAASRSGGDL